MRSSFSFSPPRKKGTGEEGAQKRERRNVGPVFSSTMFSARREKEGERKNEIPLIPKKQRGGI